MEKELYDQLYEVEDRHWYYLSRKYLVKIFLEKYVPLKKGSLIVDVGCGTGGMLDFMSSMGRVVGLDYFKEPLHFCKKRNHSNLIQGSAVSLPLKENSVDLITLFNMLYHEKVNDDGETLSQMYKTLKPGGKILVTEAAYKFLERKGDRAGHGKTRYTASEIEGFLSKAGFQIERVGYYNKLLLPLAILSKWTEGIGRKKEVDLEELHVPQEALNSIISKVLCAEHLFSFNINIPFGLNIIAIGKKVS